MMRTARILVALLSVCLGHAAWAKVELAAIFTEHMVVQRDRPIPVWGWAPPGQAVTARLAGQQKAATANAQGRWQVEFAPLPAGGPHTLEVEAGEKVTVTDVLVGEVWVCSGQSNMAFEMAGVRDAAKEMAEADYPLIRMWHQGCGASLQPQERCIALDGQWVVCTPAMVGRYSAVGYFFARDLHRQLKVPIGMIHTSWGATSAAQWTSEDALAAEPKLQSVLDFERRVVNDYIDAVIKLAPELQKWKDMAQAAAARDGLPPPAPLTPLPADPVNLYTHLPTAVFNYMLNPLTAYSIRGVIWYQGEQDNTVAEQYRTAFPTLIRDWRQRFRDPKMPFLFVQLCTINAPPEEPPERSCFAELREAQAACLSVSNTAMAVTIDLGDINDGHPRNKQDVGKRLALAARATVYGEKVAFEGPTYRGMKGEGSKIRLAFDHAAGGLVTRNQEAPRGFAVAGKDGKFVWAQAKVEGESVLVWSDRVAQPAAVRYAWADMPLCNLYNQAGLPAVPFRTDAPPGP